MVLRRYQQMKKIKKYTGARKTVQVAFQVLNASAIREVQQPV